MIFEGALLADGSDPRKLYMAGFSNTNAVSGFLSSSSGTQNPRRAVGFDTRTGTATVREFGPGDYSQGIVTSAQTIGDKVLASGNAGGGDPNGRGGVLTGSFAANGQPLTNEPSVTGFGNVVQNLGGSVYFSTGDSVYKQSFTTGSIFGTNPSGFVLPGKFLFTDPDTFYVAALGNLSTVQGGLFRATRGANGVFDTAVRLGDAPALLQLAYDGKTLYATTYANAAGNLVTDNRLLAIDPTTGAFTVLASAGTGRSFRGVEAVPEPATLAALGLGALAPLKRRKRA